jgi:hypothetical protein
MQPLEFYEALARIAEMVSLTPHGCSAEKDFWTLERRIHLELAVKLEALILHMKKHLTDRVFKEENKDPEQSLFF